MDITEFDTLPDAEARTAASVWAAIPSWVDAVVAARPHGSAAALASHADARSRTWTRTDLDAALAHHPRIGQRPAGSGGEADASRREQSAMAQASDAAAAAMRAANAAYEERFGRVFLIRAAGRSADEMLAEARRRLENDDETEAGEALNQLREIALLRLRGAVTDTTIEESA